MSHASKVWCPDLNEPEPPYDNVRLETRICEAAEEDAAPELGDVIEVHVRDTADNLHIFHVEVDTSPRFEAFRVGPGPSQ
jgi:hypothetical protein